jgi:hypothetical protein
MWKMSSISMESDQMGTLMTLVAPTASEFTLAVFCSPWPTRLFSLEARRGLEAEDIFVRFGSNLV